MKRKLIVPTCELLRVCKEMVAISIQTLSFYLNFGSQLP